MNRSNSTVPFLLVVIICILQPALIPWIIGIGAVIFLICVALILHSEFPEAWKILVLFAVLGSGVAFIYLA